MKVWNKFVVWFSAAALLLALGVTLSFLAFSQMEEAAMARGNTHALLNGADDLLSALKDAETGQRGYLLTGDADFLQPYLVVQNSLIG